MTVPLIERYRDGDNYKFRNRGEGEIKGVELEADVRVAGGEIEVGVDTQPDGRAHLWVRDNGAGMDAETQRRVFEPFFTTKPVDEGTGLGLSVVHGIVTGHGGMVTLDSAPGRGTTVHVVLPGAPAAAQGLALPPTPAPTTEGRGRHLLVLDDDAVMVELAAQWLRRSGYRVTTVQHPEAAVATLQAPGHDFAALVSDYDMPGLNGLEVVRRVRELRPDLPVVLTSGLIDDALRAQAAAIGVQAVVNKEDLPESLAPAMVAALQSAG